MSKGSNQFIFLLLSLFFFSLKNLAQVSSSYNVSDQEKINKELERDSNTIYVIGSSEEAFYTPGSAHFISKEKLKTFDYTDIGRVLDKVPGVYIQEEDGLGLRPNIGLRGPYSSPAAYYFPSTSRTQNVEVFKGPSSVAYGPNSIGGAVNMISHDISEASRNMIDLSTGFMNKYEILSSNTTGNTGYLISASQKNGDLVRQIDGLSDLEFRSRDILAKLSFDLTRAGGRKQKITAKVSYSDEDSDESYLGVGSEDFKNNLYNRYKASQDDNVQWKRTAANLKYDLSVKSNIKTTATLYHHEMKRDWYKFNTLNGLSITSLSQALIRGDRSTSDLLSGRRDSLGAADELVFGGNDRSYLSQGAQVISKLSIGENIYQDITFGLKLHRDQVKRNHTLINANMENGSIRYIPNSQRLGSQAEDEANALALFIQDEINIGNFTAMIGTRFETVKTTRNPRVLSRETIQNNNQVLVPGLGLNYSLTENIAVLAGVNRGVTMVGPGQSDNIKPEESINYEAGFRLKGALNLEAIGFYSDYQNLKGTCSFSSGCAEEDLDREFNGGKARVFGLESAASTSFNTGSLTIPISLNYTFTKAQFRQAFTSDNSDWGIGDISIGDPLPYIPQHQISVSLGLNYKRFSANINTLWKDQVADQAVLVGRVNIPSYSVTDLAFSYRYGQESNIYLRADNIFANDYITSLRPFGLRPGKIRSFTAGIKHVF